MVQWSIILMLCFESAYIICACQVSSSHLRTRVDELQVGRKFPLHVVVDACCKLEVDVE